MYVITKLWAFEVEGSKWPNKQYHKHLKENKWFVSGTDNTETCSLVWLHAASKSCNEEFNDDCGTVPNRRCDDLHLFLVINFFIFLV